MKMDFQWKWIGAACVLALFAGTDAGAQEASVFIGNTNPVTDALGRNFPGSWSSPSSECARVEIRKAGPGGLIVAPDSETGEGSPLNELVRVSRIGMNVEPPDEHLGKFMEEFTDRPALAGTTNFVRVFDRSDPAAAIYYADTAPFQDVPSDQWDFTPYLYVEFGALKLVSTGAPDVDSDGDGIPDAMEGDMGLDAGNPDTDGDGYDDWFEAHYDDYLLAGEPDRPLEVQITAPADLAADPHIVSWWTIPVPGMTYWLDYRSPWVDGVEYTNIWSGTFTDTYLEIDVEDWVQTDDPKGFFRVRIPYSRP
ncbi:MAG TPA: hypothetical protein DCM68_08390 [Verrucomicrobia bacterium]|nr:hypothetical protein [Verrucomicrobiota bacterium]